MIIVYNVLHNVFKFTKQCVCQIHLFSTFLHYRLNSTYFNSIPSCSPPNESTVATPLNITILNNYYYTDRNNISDISLMISEIILFWSTKETKIKTLLSSGFILGLFTPENHGFRIFFSFWCLKIIKFVRNCHILSLLPRCFWCQQKQELSYFVTVATLNLRTNQQN